MARIRLPQLQPSNVCDTHGDGGGAGSGGGLAKTAPAYYTVVITARTSAGVVIEDPLWVEITGYWDVVSGKGNPKAGSWTVRVDSSVKGWPEIKVHDKKDSADQFVYGVKAASGVVPGTWDFVYGMDDGQQNVQGPIAMQGDQTAWPPKAIKAGTRVTVDVVLDPVSSGATLNGLKVAQALSPSGGAGFTLKTANTTRNSDGSNPDETILANAQALPAGGSPINLQADTTPDGFPVTWQIISLDGSTPPQISTFGNWTQLPTTNAGGFAVGLTLGGVTFWWPLVLVAVNVTSSSFQVTPTWKTKHGSSASGTTSGIGTGSFFDEQRKGASAPQGFNAQLKVTLQGAGANQARGWNRIVLGVIQNLLSEVSSGTYADGSSEQTKYRDGFPLVDTSNADQSPLMKGGEYHDPPGQS